MKKIILDENNNEVTESYIVREVMIPTNVRIPLYKNNEVRPAEELAEYGLTVKEFTDEEWTERVISNFYEENPNLEEAVRNYVKLFEGTNVEPTADSATIRANISDLTLQGTILAAIHDIELNYNIVTGNGLDAYYNLSNLIKYLS